MSHPTDIHQLAAWLRLELEPGIGPVHARALIKVFGHASNVYSADMDELRALGSERLASQLAQPLSKLKEMTIEQALRWSEQAENHILTPFHPCYPKRLAELEDAPIVLYVRGNPACLSQESLAIVGARQATADGRERAHGFARMLAERGYCIVSGLAHGIDAAAHRGAMSASREAGMTAAVMGTGVDIVYPLSHRSLADEILKCGGALVSAMRLGTPALPVHFPRRNRIVAGLTMGVLVVEAAFRSGSLITAREAADIGREVFAIPGSIRSALSRGPHALIRQGAVLVETPDDILEELGHQDIASRSRQTRTQPDLRSACMGDSMQGQLPIDETDPFAAPSSQPTSPLAQTPSKTPALEPDSPVWHAIGYDPITEDAVLKRTRIRLADMQTQLLDLLVQGWVEQDATGRFCRSARDHALRTSSGA